MKQIKTRIWSLGVLLTLGAGTTSAQQVEYVTRNVEPTHAVRFNSSPIRVTITDRGIRQPLASASFKRRGFKHRRFGPAVHRFGSRFVGGGGMIIIRERSDEARDDRPRQRTFYGRGHERRVAETTTDRPDPAMERRDHLRRMSFIQAQNRRNAPKPGGADADDR